MCTVLRKEYILKFFFNDVRVKLCGVFGKRSNDKAIFGNVSVSIFGNISGKYLTKFILLLFLYAFMRAWTDLLCQYAGFPKGIFTMLLWKVFHRKLINDYMFEFYVHDNFSRSSMAK